MTPETICTGKPCKRGHTVRLRSNGRCVECNRLYAAANTDKARVRAKRYRDRHKDDPTYKKKRIAHTLKWTALNREKAAARTKKWYHSHQEQVRASRHKRKALKRSAEGFYTGDDIRRIYALQRGKCAYCRRSLKKDYHIDHIVPLINGGTNWPNNLQLTCGLSGNRCNLRKKSKDPIYFANELGMLL